MQTPTDEPPLSSEDYLWLRRNLIRGNVWLDPRDIPRRDDLYRRLHAAMPNTAERAAIHEAGHAVVGRALGWQVNAVRLGTERDGEGKTDFRLPKPMSPLSGESLDVLPDWVAVGVAGYLAEEIATGRCNPLREGARMAQYVFLKTGNGALDEEGCLAYVEREEERAAGFLRANWATVESLGRALVAAGKVEGDDLDAILSCIESVTPC